MFFKSLVLLFYGNSFTCSTTSVIYFSCFFETSNLYYFPIGSLVTFALKFVSFFISFSFLLHALVGYGDVSVYIFYLVLKIDILVFQLVSFRSSLYFYILILFDKRCVVYFSWPKNCKSITYTLVI